MKLDDLVPDKYTRIARIAPFLILTLPLGIAAYVWFPDKVQEWKSALGSSALWMIGAILISQFVRDAGSKKQKYLFERWGGAPTTKILRHRHSSNSVVLGRRHRRLEQLLSKDSPASKMPTKDEEASNPSFADEKYEACAHILRNKTREADKFKLIFIENCYYGFRRNLWGLKPLGLTITSASALAIALRLWKEYNLNSNSLLIETTSFFVLSLLMFLSWTFCINSNWVESAANKYAQALIDSCDNIEVNGSQS